MKPILSRPDLMALASLIDQYDEILRNHAQAKVISLPERRRITQERRYFVEKFKKLSKKAIFG